MHESNNKAVQNSTSSWLHAEINNTRHFFRKHGIEGNELLHFQRKHGIEGNELLPS